MSALEFAKVFGVPFALVVFFVACSWWRESRMAKRLDEQSDRYVKSLETVVMDNTKAMQDMARGIEKLDARLAAVEGVVRVGERSRTRT